KIVIRTSFSVVIAAGVVASLVYVLKPAESSVLYWRGVLPVGTALFLLWAITWRKILASWMGSRTPSRWLVLGYGQLASWLWRDVGASGALGQLCFLDEQSGDAGLRPVAMPSPEGSVSALPKFLDHSWTGVILATEQPPKDAI